MFGCSECIRVSRRTFLRRAAQGVGAAAIADPLLRSVASTYAFTPGGTGNILVLCQLHGGLDAINVLAPFTNSVYMSKRPTLKLGASDVTPLPDHPDLGLNNKLPYLNELYANGELAIVQQVAYPNGNGSHAESTDVYEFGVRNVSNVTASIPPWYERLRKQYFNVPYGVMVARNIGNPQTYGYPYTSQSGAVGAYGALANLKHRDKPLQQAVLDMHKRIDAASIPIRTGTAGFNSTGTARGDFWRAAALASANLGTQIFKVVYFGYDSHSGQTPMYDASFLELNGQLKQFCDDMRALNLWQKTCIVIHSEFGRRNLENGSAGTDHGHGGHMLLIGPGVNAGLHGQAVTSSDLNQDSLPGYVDFRAVFGQTIQQWLGFDPAPIFNLPGESYDPNVGSSLFA